MSMFQKWWDKNNFSPEQNFHVMQWVKKIVSLAWDSALENQWQPIETAPKYEFILGYCEKANCKGVASESKGCMIICIIDDEIIDSLGIKLNWEFTHWQPLPQPPNKKI